MTPAHEVEPVVVEKLRGIADLVQLLGGDPNEGLRSYAALYQDQDEATVEEAVTNMEDGTALLVFNGLSLTSRGDIPAWTHSYTLVFKAPGLDTTGTTPGFLKAADVLINGVPDGESLPFECLDIHPNFDPPTGLTYTRGRDGAGSEVWQFNFQLVERF